MHPFQVTQDSKWFRFIDSMVLVTIGVMIGLVFALLFPVTIEKTKVIRTIQVQKQESNTSSDSITIDEPYFTLDEI